MLTNVLIGAGVGLVVALALRALITYIKRSSSSRQVPGYGPFAMIGALAGGIVGVYFLNTAGGQALADIPSIDTVEQFQQQVLQSEKPVLVEFYTDTCPWCKVVAPRLMQLQEEYGNRLAVVKVDGNSEAVLDLLRAYHIRAYPTVYLFAGGRPRQSWEGAAEKEEYAREIEKHLPENQQSPKGSDT